MAKQDGVQLMIVGESADLIFGGMDKLISPQWTFDAFAKRYTFLAPQLVLKNPVDQSELFEQYRQGEKPLTIPYRLTSLFLFQGLNPSSSLLPPS
jgi:hypothetical protein